jgi:hypothetical protein
MSWVGTIRKNRKPSSENWIYADQSSKILTSLSSELKYSRKSCKNKRTITDN